MPGSQLTFLATPRISSAQFAVVLAAYASPALPQAAMLYQACAGWRIDPAIALAFFVHESSCGTAGVARATRNWGNLRRSQGMAYRVAEGWAWYSDWSASLQDWCSLITWYVTTRNLPTIDLVIPKYAPSSDGNAPARYIRSIEVNVAWWQRQDARRTTPLPPPPQDEPLTPPRAYRVLSDATRVRQGPATTFPIADVLSRDTVVSVDLLKAVGGEAVQPGEARWAHLADGRGFVYLPLVEAI